MALDVLRFNNERKDEDRRAIGGMVSSTRQTCSKKFTPDATRLKLIARHSHVRIITPCCEPRGTRSSSFVELANNFHDLLRFCLRPQRRRSTILTHNHTSTTKMQSSTSTAPTSATQTKGRLYAQLAASLGRTARAISQTADLCEQLQVDLHAMRVFHLRPGGRA